MVERETAVASERKLVSAVIYNRLKQRMPLGIDATLRYGLGIQGTRPLTQGAPRAATRPTTRAASRACRPPRSATRVSPRCAPRPGRRRSTTCTTCASRTACGISSRPTTRSSAARRASTATTAEATVVLPWACARIPAAPAPRQRPPCPPSESTHAAATLPRAPSPRQASGGHAGRR